MMGKAQPFSLAARNRLAKHGGMSDLAANAERFVWNGTAYANARPAPAVDLRPHAPRPRHH